MNLYENDRIYLHFITIVGIKIKNEIECNQFSCIPRNETHFHFQNTIT